VGEGEGGQLFPRSPMFVQHLKKGKFKSADLLTRLFKSTYICNAYAHSLKCEKYKVTLYKDDSRLRLSMLKKFQYLAF